MSMGVILFGVLAIGGGLAAGAIGRGERRLAAIPAGAAIGLMLALAATHLLDQPYVIWNNVKLAPAAALWVGQPLYPSATDSFTDWVQGPLGVLVFAVVGLAGSANAAVIVGGLINAAFALLPIGLLLRQPDVSRGAAIAAACLPLGLAVSEPAAWATTFWIGLDPLALGFVVLAITVVGEAGTRRLVLAGLLLAAAVWTKQSLVAAAIGLIVAVWWFDGWRRAAGLAASTTAFGLGFLAIFAPWFGLTTMLEWMVTVPLSHPWLELGTNRPRLPLETAWEVASYLWLPAAAVVVGWASRGLPSLPRLPATLLMVASFQLPAAIAGLLKAGGNRNHIGVVSLLLAAAAATLIARRDSARWMTIAATVAGWAAIAAALVGGTTPARLDYLIANRHDTPLDRAAEIIRGAPGRVYLPWHPLVTVLEERRLDHIEYGLFDYELAGFPITLGMLEAGLPRDVQVVAYPDPAFMALLPRALPGRLLERREQPVRGFKLYSLAPPQ